MGRDFFTDMTPSNFCNSLLEAVSLDYRVLVSRRRLRVRYFLVNGDLLSDSIFIMIFFIPYMGEDFFC